MQLHAVRKELDRSYQQASDLQTKNKLLRAFENKLLRAFENDADIYCNQGHSMKTQNVSEALVQQREFLQFKVKALQQALKPYLN